MAISVLKLAEFFIPLKTLWVFNLALRLLLIFVETRILINQYSLSIIISEVFVNSSINQSWAILWNLSLPVIQKWYKVMFPIFFQNNPR